MLLQEVHEFFLVLAKVFYFTLVGIWKSVVPSGWLAKKSVDGKIVLITGSGSGIGRLMAIEFAKLGAQLVLWDVNEKMNLETKELVDAVGGFQAFAYQIDLSDRKQIYAVAERVKQEVGNPDILVNNAGIVSGKKLFECPDELMEKTMAINCNALFYTTKAFLPGMMAQRQGHIVNICSVAGIAGVSGLVDYCASKHGAVGLSEALRVEMTTLGMPITVTTVCPFYINTGMFDGVKTFCPRLFPILEPDFVVSKIITATLTDAEELFLPRATNFMLAMKGFLPKKALDVIGDYLGFNHTMDTWKGRTPMVNGKI